MKPKNSAQNSLQQLLTNHHCLGLAEADRSISSLLSSILSSIPYLAHIHFGSSHFRKLIMKALSQHNKGTSRDFTAPLNDIHPVAQKVVVLVRHQVEEAPRCSDIFETAIEILSSDDTMTC